MIDERTIEIQTGLDPDIRDIFNEGKMELACLLQLIRELQIANGKKPPGQPAAVEPVIKAAS